MSVGGEEVLAHTVGGRSVQLATLVLLSLTSGHASTSLPSDAPPPVSATQSAARAVALRLFEAFNRHDVEGLAALYGDDAVLVSPDHAEPLRGRGGVRKIYAPLFAQFPDLHDRVVSITAEGERVAIEFVASGCMPDQAACFELPIASVLTLRDGLIVRDASYFDVVP